MQRSMQSQNQLECQSVESAESVSCLLGLLDVACGSKEHTSFVG